MSFLWLEKKQVPDKGITKNPSGAMSLNEWKNYPREEKRRNRGKAEECFRSAYEA